MVDGKCVGEVYVRMWWGVIVLESSVGEVKVGYKGGGNGGDIEGGYRRRVQCEEGAET